MPSLRRSLGRNFALLYRTPGTKPRHTECACYIGRRHCHKMGRFGEEEIAAITRSGS